jgi:hypothetical protein
VITEPEPAIILLKNTRKSGFACITLLSSSLELEPAKQICHKLDQAAKQCAKHKVRNYRNDPLRHSKPKTGVQN